jgi:carnitine O-palmitoyltransferase 1, liver isoform
MPAPALKEIEAAKTAAEDLLSDVDLRIYVHDHYGKGLMKKCRVSPDAFIQMALQLAYYRVSTFFTLIYSKIGLQKSNVVLT